MICTAQGFIGSLWTMVTDLHDWLVKRGALDKVAAGFSAEDLRAPGVLPEVSASAPLMVLCSPHPDDEVITGILPYRLRREGWRVVNLAVTLGSDPLRRTARREELRACCERLGFEMDVCGSDGFERVRLDTRRTDPEHWHKMVGEIAERLRALQPTVVAFPHSEDHHPTHIAVSGLVRQALVRAFSNRPLWCVETEFWAPMVAPDLLVEADTAGLADILEALLCHSGELSRHPYHLRLPGWMEDSVRRASELLQGMGAEALPMSFGTLYRRYPWGRSQREPETTHEPLILRTDDAAADAFPPLAQP